MNLPKTLYIMFNGSPVAVASTVERMNSIISILSDKGTVALKEAPEHHEDNYRVRFIPEVSGLLM